MDESNKNFRLIKAKPRCKKLKPKIDLAAMVSVSFLLIIFFMVTKELSKPQIMDFGLPESGECHPTPCGGNFDRRITLLLDDDNKIISYWGLLEIPNEQPKKIDYGKNGIRKELIRIDKIIQNQNGHNEKRAIVIIKPSKKSNYGNLVDILDEMAICNIPTYAVLNDFTPDEVKLLASK